MNNTVNKLILERGSCEKLHKKLRFADPVFITSGINIVLLCCCFRPRSSKERRENFHNARSLQENNTCSAANQSAHTIVAI